ncbi:hypothetical protein DL96DRAFT_1603573, partial [Flagelloscypha sp. PMI_526]
MSPPPVVVGWTPDDAGTYGWKRKQPRKAAGWVPRPRNPFIIFRCEFSKENTRSILEAQGVHVPEHHDKSLSKQLARKEKEVHARDNPDYKFRPKKRTSAPTSSHSSPQSSPTSLRGPRPKRRIRAPPFPQNGRRHKFRSPSVNHLPMPSIPSTASTPPLPSDDLPIPRPKRRSRSLTGIDWMEIQYFGSSVNATSRDRTECRHLRAKVPHGSMYQGPNFGNGFYMTPLAAVSSSLANWNGEYSKPAISVSFPTSPASSDAPSITIVSPGTSEPSTITQIPTYFTTAGRIGVANPDVMWGTSSDIPAAEYFPILPKPRIRTT